MPRLIDRPHSDEAEWPKVLPLALDALDAQQADFIAALRSTECAIRDQIGHSPPLSVPLLPSKTSAERYAVWPKVLRRLRVDRRVIDASQLPTRLSVGLHRVTLHLRDLVVLPERAVARLYVEHIETDAALRGAVNLLARGLDQRGTVLPNHFYERLYRCLLLV